jgi:hypothetical protein
VFGNSVGVVGFTGRASELTFESRVRLEHAPLPAFADPDGEIEDMRCHLQIGLEELGAVGESLDNIDDFFGLGFQGKLIHVSKGSAVIEVPHVGRGLVQREDGVVEMDRSTQRMVDLRVSIVPTTYGQDAAIRIQDRETLFELAPAAVEGFLASLETAEMEGMRSQSIQRASAWGMRAAARARTWSVVLMGIPF